MNKSFLSALITLTLSATLAKGQVSQTLEHLEPVNRNGQQVAAILARQQAALRAAHAPAGKTTAVAQRLIAYSGYNFDVTTGFSLGKTDSAVFKYSGSRGSKYNKDLMNFAYPSAAMFDSRAPLFTFAGSTIASQISEPDIMADSTITWNSNALDLTGAHIYQIAGAINQTYDAYDNITFLSDQHYPTGSPASWEHYINTYDASHHIISCIKLRWISADWDTISRTSYTYDASHRLIQDSTENRYGAGLWTQSYKNIYTYNTAGELTYAVEAWNVSGIWEEKGKTIVTYNTDHTVHMDSVSFYSSVGLWEPSYTDSIGYTTGLDYWTYYRHKAYAGLHYEDYIATKHVSASGLPDTLYVAAHSTTYGVAPSYFTAGSRNAYIYNSYNNPVALYSARYNIADSASGMGSYNATPTSAGHFYYEPTPSGVKNVTQVHEAMSMYPNPATNELRISRPSAAKGAYTIINFTNTLGQTIRTDNMPWMNETETFSLAGFAPGMYIVTLQNKNGEVLSTQKIIKQ